MLIIEYCVLNLSQGNIIHGLQIGHIRLEMLIKITNWIYLPLPFPISISEYFLWT